MSRDARREEMRKHYAGMHDQKDHGKWSKDAYDEEVEDVIVDMNGRVLSYPYPIGKRIRETNRRRLRKEG